MTGARFPLLVWRVLAGALLLLALLSCRPAPPAVIPAVGGESGAIGIAGNVRNAQGRPVAGAWVYAYRSARGGLRGPADFAAESAEDGRYFLDLVEGHYWLVARFRPGGGESGPPRPGDAWAIFPGNPVVVAEGKVAAADFQLQSGGSRPLMGRNIGVTESDTGFSGQVVDAAGRPVGGVIAMAYRDADFHRMPDVTSAPTPADGRFILHVPAAGRYCLAVRSGGRGQPMAGELYGLLGVGEAACRTVGQGELIDVGNISVAPFRR